MAFQNIIPATDYDFAIASNGDDVIRFQEPAANVLPDERTALNNSIGIDAVVLLGGDDIAVDDNASRIYFGNTGKDLIDGAGGSDTIALGRDEDEGLGGDGNDMIFGNAGNDDIMGDEGEDILFGGQDDDNLSGGAGRDFLSGDRGADTLVGNDNGDTLQGGEGRDVFVMSSFAADTIVDFQKGEDLIQLPDGVTFDNTRISGDILYAGATTFRFANGVAATLDPSDFIGGPVFSIDGDLSLGSVVNGALETSDPEVYAEVYASMSRLTYADHYRLVVTPGQPVEVNLTSSSVDTVVQIVNSATGEIVETDDDGGMGTNSRLLFTPAAGIDYLVRVTSYNTGEVGNYTVSVNPSGPPSSTAVELYANDILTGVLGPSDPINPTPLSSLPSYNDPFFAEDRFADDYRLLVAPGNTLTVALNSSEFDPFLQLVDGNTGAILDFNDDFSGLNSQLTFTPMSGIGYIARVTSYAPGDDGSYTISTTLV